MVRRLSALIALALALAACTGNADSSTSTASTTPGSTVSGETTATTETTTSTTEPVTTTARPAPPITDVDLSGLEGLSDEVKGQLETLIHDAQEVRGLAFETPPTITVVTADELAARVRSGIEDQAEDFPADESLYKLLGLLAENADFQELALDLYAERVAGYYDGDVGEIVVPATDEGFNVLQQSTVVHELVHALTDQHFQFNDELQQMVDEDRLDEATAYQALIEGDASLAQVLWIQGLSQREIGEWLAESLAVDSSALDAAPRFLRESLEFPYDTGLAFAQDLYFGGDWQAVDEAYAKLPSLPASTEQVISPSDYGVDLPVSVDIPTVDVAGYQLERTSVWGEEGFRILLNQGSTADNLLEAVDGWGGDSYSQWFDGVNAAMLLVYQGDTSSDVSELEDALLTYATESVAEENFYWVDTRDGLLYFIAADEVPVGEHIRASVGLG